MTPAARRYRGRFAPSPTGPLHFGSLVAAVASYAQALSQGGEWLVRIEDLDPTREVPGASEAILTSLDCHGFVFPQPVYQSHRLDQYAAVIEQLLQSGQAYYCTCSRRLLEKTAPRGRAGLIYPGTCRDADANKAHPVSSASSVRLRTDTQPISFADRLQGRQGCSVAEEIGDFLLRRGDGYVAYQTAVALDDHAQGITEVVRGTDLLDSTFMQLALLRTLQLTSPEYAHFPVITATDGRKLSKQGGATEIDNKTPKNNILRALSILLQEPPDSLKTASLSDIWGWTRENWDYSPLTGLRSLPEQGIMTQ